MNRSMRSATNCRPSGSSSATCSSRPRLWGVGSTAPYGHNGAFRMLGEIIAAHGGEARFARDAYLALSPDEQDAVIAFLRTQVIEAQ